jgi:small subunit ribosomal protein S18
VFDALAHGETAAISHSNRYQEHHSMPTLSKTDLRKLRKKRARLKKKVKCRFCPDGKPVRPVYIDYKNIAELKQLIDREGKILPRRRTGTVALYQRAVRQAVLRARFIGMLPFVSVD